MVVALITKEQALTEDKFHLPTSVSNNVCVVWRRNGATKTWKTRPDEYSIPVKYGLRIYGYITEAKASTVYVPADCPACHGSKY